MRYFFIREQVKGGNIEVFYIGTEHQLADIFTKPLARLLFTKLRSKLGMHFTN